MKPYFLTALFVSVCLAVEASNAREQALARMVKTEYDFAALASSANTREAFLTYLADDALMFAKGLRNGKELYASHPADDSLLAWEPSFADMAASLDFGYDMGPYTHRPKRTDEKPSRHGHFVTIWKRLPSGEWRVAFDTGYAHPAPESGRGASVQYASHAGAPVANPSPEAHNSLLQAERALIAAQNKTGSAAYEAVLPEECHRLYRGRFPVANRAEFLSQANLVSEKLKLSYELLDGAVASSGDLGYVYGWVSFQNSTKENADPERANYLRIWKRTNGQDWKLVLELTGPG